MFANTLILVFHKLFKKTFAILNVCMYVGVLTVHKPSHDRLYVICTYQMTVSSIILHSGISSTAKVQPKVFKRIVLT